MMSYVVLSAPVFTSSLLTMVNKTATTITISWTPVPCDANGCVINVASDRHTVTQQVKEGSHNINTVCVSLMDYLWGAICVKNLKIFMI